MSFHYSDLFVNTGGPKRLEKSGPLPPALEGRIVIVSPSDPNTLVVLLVENDTVSLVNERALTGENGSAPRFFDIVPLSPGLLLGASENWPMRLRGPDAPLRRADFEGALPAPADGSISRTGERKSVVLSSLSAEEEPLRHLIEVGANDEVLSHHALSLTKRWLSPGPLATSAHYLSIENPAIAQMGTTATQAVALVDAPVRIRRVPRGEHDTPPSLISTEASWCKSVINAYSDNDVTVIDWLSALTLKGPGFLERVVVEGDTVSSHILDDRPLETVSIDPLVAAGKPSRLYAVSADELIGFDLSHHVGVGYRFQNVVGLGRPYFLRDPQGQSDDEGWILIIGYNKERGLSELFIFDATSLRQGPVATITLASALAGGSFLCHLAPQPKNPH